MGKNFDNTYRRTYEGDYTKAYQDDKQVKQMRLERQKDYDFISKKVGTTLYNKSEKGFVYENNQSGTVEAKGPGGKRRRRVAVPEPEARYIPKVEARKTEARPIRPTTEVKVSQQSAKSKPVITTIKSEGRTTKLAPQKASDIVDAILVDKEVVEPKQKKEHATRSQVKEVRTDDPRKTKPKQKTTSSKLVDKFSYIKKDSLAPPVRRIYGTDQYEDIYTEKRIDRGEAIERLKYVGFAPAPLIDIVKMILNSFFALLVPFIGPIILFGIGNNYKKKTMVTYERTVKGQKYFFALDASPEDINEFKRRYKVCAILAVVYFFLHYSIFISR